MVGVVRVVVVTEAEAVLGVQPAEIGLEAGVGPTNIDQLVRVAADELGRLNIRVNSVQPGMTRTGATERAFANTEMMQQFLDGQALDRHGEPEDQAQAVRYMAGPESGWVTGQLLTVDGGHTLRSFIDYASLMDLPDQGDPTQFV